MTCRRIDGWAPSEGGIDSRLLTRRALLRAIGAGTVASVVAEYRFDPALAAAQATPDADATASDHRNPGGPDLDELLWDLEFDPEKIFRYVADEIAYESYSGVLRGVKGTQWSLAGNSVDQALLLAEMLTRSQVTIRFVAGELDDESASRLADSMRIDEATARSRLDEIASSGQISLERHAGLTAEQMEALQSPEALRERLLDLAGAQLESSLATIDGALTSSSTALPEATFQLAERERRQHVWVQYAAGPDWVDLDPTFPDSQPGQAYAEPAETWDALPDELYHRVRFRATVERNVGGAPVREESFVHEARAADLVGVPVVFAHVDPNALRKLGVAIAGLGEVATQYVPSLLAGTEGQLGNVLAFGSGGGVLGALGGDDDGEGDAIGEWLEIEVLPVDAPVRQLSREVFDRVGADRRAAGPVDLSTLPPVDLTDDPEFGTIFLPLEAVWLIGVVGGRIPGSYFSQDFAVDDIEADMAVLVHGYHATRDALQVEIAARHGYRWYHSEPNLTAGVLAPASDGGSGRTLSASIDLIHQGYGFVPFQGSTPTVHPLVLAGVLAHVAERTGAEAAAELSPDSPPPAGSVMQVFEAAAQAGVGIVALVPGSGSPDELAISDVAKTRIRDALANGYVVVVPERAVLLDGMDQVGWWQVEPTTGQTFDLMENGRGGSPMGENTVIIVGGPAWRAATAWKILSFVMGAIIGFAVASAIMRYPN